MNLTFNPITMPVSDWFTIDNELLDYEKTLNIPNGRLEDVYSIQLLNENDLKKIPNEGGCYWIWTNEPIIHSFHPVTTKNPLPVPFDGGEIVYNGIAKDDVRGRIKKHLFGNVNEGMSAMGIDLLTYEYKSSHRKKAFSSDKSKAPYLNGTKISTKETLLKINLSNDEKEFVIESNHPIYFRNGINITEDKHKNFCYKVYFLCGFKSASYGDIIEKRWRESYGLPKLCTYSKGR